MISFKEYQQQAQFARRALNKIGYDVKMEVTTVSSPWDPKNELKYGIMYTAIAGPTGVLPFYNDVLNRDNTRQDLAEWMVDHGVKAGIITKTPEGYTKTLAKRWKRQLIAHGVELDRDTAHFAYAICLGDGDPLLTFDDLKEVYNNLAEDFFGDNLTHSIGLIISAFTGRD